MGSTIPRHLLVTIIRMSSVTTLELVEYLRRQTPVVVHQYSQYTMVTGTLEIHIFLYTIRKAFGSIEVVSADTTQVH